MEGRYLLGSATSYMGGEVGHWLYMWTTSDIWNHLFSVFTGFAPDSPATTAAQNDDRDYWGQCPDCYKDVSDPSFYVVCAGCHDLTEIFEIDFVCQHCGRDGQLDDDDFYIECNGCYSLLPYEWFSAYNSGGINENAAATVTAIDITGYLDANGAFVASPWYTYQSNASNLSAGRSGEYAVYFLDEQLDTLTVTHFDVNRQAQVATTDGTALTQMSRVPIDITVRFPDGAAWIVLARGEEELYVREVSPHTPEVAFTGLRDYDMLDSAVTLTWDAYDPSGDDLFFELWYCPEEGEYHHVATNITGNAYTVDLTGYPGSDAGYFYLYATNGVRTGEIDSPWVQVPFKAPEIITTQSYAPQVKITDEIILDADVYDMQDGWMWFEGVRWLLNGREYMSGSYLWVWPYELAPGSHTFTLVATNSAGMTATRDFVYHVTDDQSDLPDDWSRDDIAAALSNGFILPLSRLDSPITRGRYAELMSTLYFGFSGLDDPFVDYVEGVVTDCGQDDYDQFLMVALDIMEAPGGRFDPNGLLTEYQAAIIMYRVLEASDPYYMGTDADEDDIIETYFEAGIADQSGPNAFDAYDNLTNRLALVRLSRLYEAVYG